MATMATMAYEYSVDPTDGFAEGKGGGCEEVLNREGVHRCPSVLYTLSKRKSGQ